ncbi:hypothetical protein TNIN_268811 [Trichonephila inaurata madagascariensis]|uniref:Uncharacterized protein n=1 Tax=Trichonephila inaurata madagascariensis TaxID=2747483 RepID=A0A8X7C255_9ARAC|nr:hypothetical protein TNIN_268811 [Trichonephila inaurata madagascariensis]
MTRSMFRGAMILHCLRFPQTPHPKDLRCRRNKTLCPKSLNLMALREETAADNVIDGELHCHHILPKEISLSNCADYR